MQKRIQKETGNNCLKRIIVAFLAVIMMTTMLHPQMVQEDRKSTRLNSSHIL